MPLAVVTGPSSGIGREIALSLADLGYHVVGAGRSEERVGPVLVEVERRGGTGEFLDLDLSSLESARAAANALVSSGRRINLLVNNAGIGVNRRGRSVDGFEIHFAINHLGHFMFTSHIAGSLAPGARVVQVTSSVHFRASGIDFGSLHRKSSFGGLPEYAVSKLANVLFVREWARRVDSVKAYAPHPGLTDTPLIPGFMKPFLRNRLLTPAQGADTPLWCATSKEVAAESGMYYARRKATEPSEAARDDDLALELWRRSEEWCGLAPTG